MSGDTDAEFIARCKHFFNDFAGKPININKVRALSTPFDFSSFVFQPRIH